MFDRFDESLRRAIVLAQEESRKFNHYHIGTEHLLLGVLRVREKDCGRFNVRIRGLTIESARKTVGDIVGFGDPGLSTTGSFTHKARLVLELALRKSLLKNDGYIGTEHLLEVLSEYEDGLAYQVFARERDRPMHKPRPPAILRWWKRYWRKFRYWSRNKLHNYRMRLVPKDYRTLPVVLAGSHGDTFWEFIEKKQREKRQVYESKVAARKGK